MATVQMVRGYKCSGCNTVLEDVSDQTALYECPDCGSNFTRNNSSNGMSHNSPCCHRFGTKIADYGCDDCDQEFEEATLYQCTVCGELFADEAEAEQCCPDEEA